MKQDKINLWFDNNKYIINYFNSKTHKIAKSYNFLKLKIGRTSDNKDLGL